MVYSNNKYATISYSDVDLIDYSQVLNTSKKSSRLNFNTTKVVVSWDTKETPAFISLLQGPYSIFTYAEMATEMNKEEWTKPRIIN